MNMHNAQKIQETSEMNQKKFRNVGDWIKTRPIIVTPIWKW